VRHDVVGKGARVDIKLPGIPGLPSNRRATKIYYNLGASLKASYGILDYVGVILLCIATCQVDVVLIEENETS